MAFYNTCSRCGSNLDPGEKCDCDRENEQKKILSAKMIKTEKAGQLCFDFKLGGDIREKISV